MRSDFHLAGGDQRATALAVSKTPPRRSLFPPCSRRDSGYLAEPPHPWKGGLSEKPPFPRGVSLQVTGGGSVPCEAAPLSRHPITVLWAWTFRTTLQPPFPPIPVSQWPLSQFPADIAQILRAQQGFLWFVNLPTNDKNTFGFGR